MTTPVCLIGYNFFSFWESTTTLPKAIRFNEAMYLLDAANYQKSIEVLRKHKISVYRSKIPLGKGGTDNVPCKVISTFLSPLFFRSDRKDAFSSEYYCCDYNEIQRFIQTEEKKFWQSAQMTILEKKNADIVIRQETLEKENKDLIAQLNVFEKDNTNLRQKTRSLRVNILPQKGARSF